MTSVAVVAHADKELGEGLEGLRRALADEGVDDPLWFEVPKSRDARACVKRAVACGADLLVVWGGDGMVQRCIDALGDAPVPIAILPAGTTNLLASNLGIPRDVAAGVRTALHGARRELDLGTLNGERFAVMAGAGWDALMIRDAAGTLKDRFGRAAYLYTGAKHLAAPRFDAVVKIDGVEWFAGPAACVLVGNVAKVFGRVKSFPDATPDDGRLDIGVVTASGAVEWARTLARTALGAAARSPFVHVTQGRAVRVAFDRKVHYELDGGHRGKTRKIKVDVQPRALTVCVPEDSTR